MSKSLEGTYKLISFNGEKATQDTKVQLTLLPSPDQKPDEYTLHLDVANLIRGTVQHHKGALKGRLISTLMMGPKYEMDIENVMGKAFASHEGLKVVTEGKKLVCTHNENVIVFHKIHADANTQ